MNAMFLDDEQIAELTKRKQRRAQVAMLRSLGVQFKVRADGSIAILIEHVKKVFGGMEVSKKDRHVEPNWDAIKNA